MAYLGNVPARSFISFERQVFTIVNSQTAYTLSHSVTNENDIRLVVNNVVQEPGSGKAYTASGTTLTLSAALTNGTDEMYCVFLGRAVGTVNAPAGSVGTSQLVADAVTSAKLATLTSAMDFQGVASDMRLNFDTTDTVANATPLMAITAKNKTDSVAQISMRRESAVDDGYIALSTQATGGVVTEKVRIHSNGVMSASAGVALGVGTANTASNVLDDYEEGTWTPVLKDGSTVISQNGSAYAYYKKVGRIVNCTFQVRRGDSASLTGTLVVHGIPFTVDMPNSTAMIGNAWFDNSSGDFNALVGTNDNDTSCFFRDCNAPDDYITSNDWVNGRYIYCSFTYQTD